MGASCTCFHQCNPSQPIINTAVVAKPSIPLTPLYISTVTREFRAYLQANQDMNTKIAQLFSAAIEKPTEALAWIKLELCQMKDGDWVHFSTFVKHAKAAVHFTLCKTKISLFGFEFLCGYFSVLTQLTTLALIDIGLGHHKFPLFVSSLMRLESVEVLNLARNDLTSNHLDQLIRAFSHLTSLARLNLDENRVSDQGCFILHSNIGFLPRLTKLGLRYNAIQAQGVNTLLGIAELREGLQIFADGNEIDAADWKRLQK